MKKIILYLFVVLLVSGFGRASACLAPHRPNADSVIVKPLDGSRKNSVTLLPNGFTTGTLNVSSSLAEKVHFYVFDVEGILICRLLLKGKEKIVIPNLKKGLYTYDVFKDDESIEQGEIIAK